VLRPENAIVPTTRKWPQALPDMLRPKLGPLSAQQLKAYNDFNFMPIGAAKQMPKA